ncbi:isoprenylcysteine carboxylmethyltransferase family protein [Anaerolentibacter hominis]|uniref:methyltransferase family protein n=1 Tax=Anaerolentibacter hominis TaxID=3079009 RepID=UPI0031B85C1B
MDIKLLLTGLTKIILGIVLMGLLLFVPAGTIHFQRAWLLLALLFIPMLAAGIVLFMKAPMLLKKRMNSKEKEPEQKSVILFSSLIFISGFILAGLDFRFQWTQLPVPAVIFGAILFLLAYGLYLEVMRENAYLSRTVEIQKNQKVVDTGLYSLVRHPMYMAAALLFLSIPFVLGCAAAIVPFLFFPAVLVKRIKNEEIILENGLQGYQEYKAKVKYRLLPFIW